MIARSKQLPQTAAIRTAWTPQRLKGLCLQLPDALPRDAHGGTDFFQRTALASAEPEARPHDPFLAIRQGPEGAAKGSDSLGGEGSLKPFILDRIGAPLRVTRKARIVQTDRPEPHRRQLASLFSGYARARGDSGFGTCAPGSGQGVTAPLEARTGLDDVDGDPDGSRQLLIATPALLADPPDCKGREPVPPVYVKSLDRPEQANIALLNKVVCPRSRPPIPRRDLQDERQEGGQDPVAPRYITLRRRPERVGVRRAPGQIGANPVDEGEIQVVRSEAVEVRNRRAPLDRKDRRQKVRWGRLARQVQPVSSLFRFVVHRRGDGKRCRVWQGLKERSDGVTFRLVQGAKHRMLGRAVDHGQTRQLPGVEVDRRPIFSKTGGQNTGVFQPVQVSGVEATGSELRQPDGKGAEPSLDAEVVDDRCKPRGSATRSAQRCWRDNSLRDGPAQEDLQTRHAVVWTTVRCLRQDDLDLLPSSVGALAAEPVHG